MTKPNLRRGDNGEAVIYLQTELNKVGAMLVPDGDFGPGTQRGVFYAQDIAKLPATGAVDQSLWKWLELQAKPFEKLHTNGVAFIAIEETGGLSYYQMVTRWPHYPGHASGITIGVGYDLRFVTAESFAATWRKFLPTEYLNELAKDIGKKGSKSRAIELTNLGIEIPFKSAWPVLVDQTLPQYYQRTESIYPSINGLPDLCRSALVSLVFNRGTSMTGAQRKEMRQIQKILDCADKDNLGKIQKKEILLGVEDEILSMKRLWAPGSGLIKRRQAEANLWRKGLSVW